MARERTPKRGHCHLLLLQQAITSAQLAHVAAHSTFQRRARQVDTDEAAAWLRDHEIHSWTQLGRLSPDTVGCQPELSKNARATILRAVQLCIQCRLDEALPRA